MNNILKITENANTQLGKIFKSAPRDSVGFLVGLDKSGCNGYSYKLDFAKENQVKGFEFVESNKIKVFIDSKAVMFMLGSEMDYTTDKLSSRFVFKNPNEKSTCGCGESFSI